MRHTGDGFGVPAGKALQTTGITVVRIVNGKFIEGWQNWDMLGLMQQIQGVGLGSWLAGSCIIKKQNRDPPRKLVESRRVQRLRPFGVERAVAS